MEARSGNLCWTGYIDIWVVKAAAALSKLTGVDFEDSVTHDMIPSVQGTSTDASSCLNLAPVHYLDGLAIAALQKKMAEDLSLSNITSSECT